MTKGKGFHVLTVLLVLTMLAAFAGTAAAAPALYNLRIMTAGDKPPDQQSVFDAIEAQTRNTLNVKITVDYIPGGTTSRKCA
jgi:ABC-type glycerol-3-phosphate transport system substrate-binding protein